MQDLFIFWHHLMESIRSGGLSFASTSGYFLTNPSGWMKVRWRSKTPEAKPKSFVFRHLLSQTLLGNFYCAPQSIRLVDCFCVFTFGD